MAPRAANTRARFRWNTCIRIGASTTLRTKAPSPNPMATMPVTRPFLSGNHLVTVLIGVT